MVRLLEVRTVDNILFLGKVNLDPVRFFKTIMIVSNIVILKLCKLMEVKGTLLSPKTCHFFNLAFHNLMPSRCFRPNYHNSHLGIL